MKQYNLGEYKAALAAFTDAYNALPDPSLLFNLGQCHRQLGDRQKAITLYKSYLRESGEPANADEIRRLVRTLEDAIAAEQTSVPQPELPVAVTSEPNKSNVEVMPSKPEVSDAPPVAIAVGSGTAPDKTKDKSRTKLIAGTTSAALGFGLLASGAAFVTLAANASNKLTVADRDGRPFDQALYDRGKSFDVAGIATLAAGGTLLVAGTVVVVLGIRERRRNSLSPKHASMNLGF